MLLLCVCVCWALEQQLQHLLQAVPKHAALQDYNDVRRSFRCTTSCA
jgi:hypothetical protein